MGHPLPPHPSFSPPPRRLLALKHFVTSPLAQSLRVKVSPRKREQSWNKTSPSVPPLAHRSPLRSQPRHGSLRPAAGAGIQPPPSPAALLHPGGSDSEDRSPHSTGQERGGDLHPAFPTARGGEAGGQRASTPGQRQPSRSTEAMAGAGATPQVHQSSGRTREASARGE